MNCALRRAAPAQPREPVSDLPVAETLDQHQRNVVRWRQIERGRDSAGATSGVDRVDPPPGPDTRSDLAPAGGDPGRAFPLEPGTVSSLQAATASGGSRPGFDAVEGTARDPLRNNSWDLSTAKSVPSFTPPPDAMSAKRDATRRETPKRQAATPARRSKPSGAAPDATAAQTQ